LFYSSSSLVLSVSVCLSCPQRERREEGKKERRGEVSR